MIEDAELLRRYAVDRSEAAFAELVQRHLGLVYSVALRQMEGDAHLAEDVVQKVFRDLARKAPALVRHPVLSGWLYRSTQFTAMDAMRSERRRRAREQEAQTMHELNTNSEPAADAEQLRPVLDQVMGQLNDRDRDAVMLRFFEGHPFAKVGAKLRLTEDAARMRVERALEKMRTQLVRRGVTSTTAALATVLAGQAGVAAPMGLASSVTGGALTSASAFTTFAASLGLTKLQLTLASALLFASGSAVVLQQRATSALAREIAAGDAEPTAELAKLREENRRLAETAAEIRSYQGDAAELARVRAEAAALTQRWQDRAAKPVGRDAADGDPTHIYEPNELDSQPVPTLQPIPVYPFDMRRVGQGGTAVVSFVVDENGRVRDAAIVRSTRSEFEASAMESVMKWKFRPGQKNGSPVTTKMTVPIVFSMEEEP